MATLQSTSANSPNPQPVAPAFSLNLTPASEGLGGRRQYLSSTRASVDSDSDYQQINNTGSSMGSRPMSRSSTFSALSTTATKDGVEGKKTHKVNDPLGYSMWMYSSGHGSLGPPDSPSDTLVDREESSVSESLEGTRGSSIGDGSHTGDDSVAGASEMGCGDNETTSSDGSSGCSKEYGREGGRDIRHQEELDNEIAPPNIPSAPPVTLSEKIRLLRTGSVSGIPPYTHGVQHYDLDSHGGDSDQRDMEEHMFVDRGDEQDEQDENLTE